LGAFGKADWTGVVANNPAKINRKTVLKIIRKAIGSLLFIPFLSPLICKQLILP
jgi:hypothetical protein